MTLLNKVKADLLEARKRRDPSVKGRATVSLLTALVGEAAAVGKNAGNRDSTDEEVMRTIKKFSSNAEETKKLLEAQFVREIGPLDGLYAMPATPLTDNLYTSRLEIHILNSYLPTQMTEENMTVIVTKFLAETKFLVAPTVGTVMAFFKSNYAGQYDGRMASEVAKKVLS